MNEKPPLTFVSLSRSQAQVFEQLSDEDFWHYATEAATHPDSLPYLDEYLVCKVGMRHCMLPLVMLREAIPSPHQLTLLPSVPHWMPGVTAWHNEIIAEIDLEAYLWSGVELADNSISAAEIQGEPANLMLVVQVQSVTLGFMVNAVSTTVSFAEEHIVPFELAPDWCLVLHQEVIRGILDEGLVLNLPALVNDIVRQIKEQLLS